jgi:hypothetical protein
MVNPCRHHGNITSCGLPIDHLRRGGVVVTWTVDGLPGLPRAPGLHVTVTSPGFCRSVGGTQTIAAQLTTHKHTTLWVDACLRAPGLVANGRAVRAMLASAR